MADTQTPPRLKLSLLGGVLITLDGLPVEEFVTLKSEALLCYLAMTNRPQSRDGLAALLWGNSSEVRAKTSLRQAVSNLRKLVGPFIKVTRQSIEFDHDSAYWLDVDAFVSAAQNGLSGGVGARRQLMAAMDLYAGDFLAGFLVRGAPEFEEWVGIQRESLRRLATQVLERLVQHHVNRGQYAVASDYLLRLLDLEPWREDAHRTQMLLLQYSGRRDAALSQYVTLCRVLRAELGEQPAAETAALYRRIRSGEVESPPPPPVRYAPPTQPTALTGRQVETAEITRLLMAPHYRLVTLTGAGGIGKTRLALGVAQELVDDFADGACFVSLASIQDPDLVAPAIAKALAIEVGPDEPVVARLRAWLQGHQLLLVLDNFEHLLPAATLVADLLTASPSLKMLITSRVALRLRGERRIAVPPLSLPKPGHERDLEQLRLSAAVELFLERAQAVRPEFELTRGSAPAIAAICRRLDGLPLGIELAAAQIRLLCPEVLLERLTRRLVALTDGAHDLPSRHRTLRSTIGRSYYLLDQPEQTLFKRLATFAGGASVEAIAAVCGPLAVPETAGKEAPDILRVLGSLLDQSLVLRKEGPGAGIRIVMLETIREYALDRLAESGEEQAVAQRHASYFHELAELAAEHLTGPQEAVWLDRLDEVHDNLRASLAWSLTHEPELALRLAGALWRYWQLRGHLGEGRRWLDQALNWSGGGWWRARALNGAGSLAVMQGDYGQAVVRYQEAMPLWHALGDEHHVAETLHYLGLIDVDRGQYGPAIPLLEEARDRFRHLGDRHGMAMALGNLGIVASAQGQYDRARELLEESLALHRQCGDEEGMARALTHLGRTVVRQGELELSTALQKESLEYFRELGNPQGIAEALEGLAEIATYQGEFQRAARLWAMAQGLRDRIGVPRDAIEEARYERKVEAARAGLGDSGFREAWSEGANRGAETVIAEALRQ